MSQTGRLSSKRGKPTYLYSILGVALVLFLFGLMGWLVIGIQKTGDLAKEKLKIRANIFRSASQKQVDSIKKFVTDLGYTTNIEYISKEKAADEYTEMEKDTVWKKYLDGYIPFEPSLRFNVKADYLKKESLNKLDSALRYNYGEYLSSIEYPLETVDNINKYAKWTIWALLALIIIVGIIVIISIDTTIRLAMYSNRFLMKTMQMVGATRNFILKPLLLRSILNGFIAGLLAIAGVIGFVGVVEKFVPEFALVRNNNYMLILFAIIIILGIAICFLSTYRSVLKYLKMKLDDLY
jgi:cell division transport system permease protein